MTPLREIVKELKEVHWDKHDTWLAELVVRVVEGRGSILEMRCELHTGTGSGVDRYINDSLSDPDINITPKDFAWLKRKAGG